MLSRCMHLLTRCTVSYLVCCSPICHEMAADDELKAAIFLVWCSQLLLFQTGDTFVIAPIDRAVEVYMHVVESVFVNAAFKWPV